METSPYPVWASQALAVVAAPAPEAQAVQRPEAEAEEAAEDVPAAPMNLAQEEDNHEEKTQVASIMRSMSWGSALNHQGQGDSSAPEQLGTDCTVAAGLLQEADTVGQQQRLMDELHQRAAAQAAAAVGLSHSAAMAAMPLLPDMQDNAQVSFAMASLAPMEATTAVEAVVTGDAFGDDELEGNGVADVEEGGAGVAAQPGEQSFMCTVCRKVFKREMNLIFHMTTHRPRQPQLESADTAMSQPVKCQDCGKEFATKYQAKKHFLRRHFQGEKPFACTKCNKKRFVVKEDLTMHMKSCGNVYVCKCGIRLCSLGALKRHCKYFSHDPESLEPRPDPSNGGTGDGSSSMEWHDGFDSGAHQMPGADSSEIMQSSAMMLQPMGDGKGGFFYPSAAVLKAAMGQPGCYGPFGAAAPPSIGGRLEAAIAASLNTMQPNGRPSAERLEQLKASHAGAPRSALLAGGQDTSSNGCAVPSALGISPANPQAIGAQSWTPEMLNGLLPSLAQALRQAQSGMPVDLQALGRAAWAPSAAANGMHHTLNPTIGASPEALNGALLHRVQGGDGMFLGMEGNPNFEQLQAAARFSHAGDANKRRKLPDAE